MLKFSFDSLDQAENRIVALKVIDVDSHDYKVNAREKDDSIEVTLHEIKVLKQLKDAKTKNVNVIFDAFQIHSQLWIVNEYCPGGSVRTLVSLVFLDFLNPFPNDLIRMSSPVLLEALPYQLRWGLLPSKLNLWNI